MKTVFVVLGTLGFITDNISATECSESYGAACVSAVRSLLLDQSAFWFGTSYTSTCPQRQDGRLECVNRHSDRTDSLLSRMTGQYSLDPAYMNFVINVTYTLQLPRRYDGCGVRITAPLRTPITFTIDPLNTTLYRPFDVRTAPKVSWPSEANAKYTAILYDVNFFSVNALYVNVHGGSVEGGEIAVNYTGPVNPLSRDSPFVWAVFEQQGALQVNDVRNYIHTVMENSSHTVYLEDFVTRFHLLGPYGVNILHMTTDEYASVIQRDRGVINNCPIYYGRFLDKIFEKRGLVSSLSSPLRLSVSVDAAFTVPSVPYTVCCVSHYPTRNVTMIDYRNYDSYGSLTYSSAPTVSLRTVQNPNMTSQTLANKLYTLVLLDFSTGGNTANTDMNLLWAVVNMHGTDVTSGEEVVEYLVPSAPSPSNLFLLILLEQTTYFNASSVVEYAGESCQAHMTERCHFRLGDFILSQNLNVVGIRRLPYTPDSYRKYLRFKVYNVSTESVECENYPQYAVPCPVTSCAGSPAAAIFSLLIVSVMASRTAVP